MKLINLIGLVLNFTGAIFLWKFIDPSPFKSIKGKAIAITTETVSKALGKMPRAMFMTKIGLGLISAGFLLQLIAAVGQE